MTLSLEFKENRYPGALIVFEGLDGSGKTSIITPLENDLGDAVMVTKQPTPFMRSTGIFRNYTDSPDHAGYEYRAMAVMAAADRIQHVTQVIEPALAEGKIVLCDRYYYSCLANLRARGYRYDRWIYELARYIQKPDLAFFLDVPVSTAVSRVRSRPDEKDRYIDMELQYALRDEFRYICRDNGGILVSTVTGEDLTYHQIITKVREVLNGKAGFGDHT